MLRTLAKFSGGGFAAVSIGSYAYAVNTMGHDSVKRIVEFDLIAAPAIIHYKWEEAKCDKFPKVLPWIFPPVSQVEEDRRFEVLHNKYARVSSFLWWLP